MCRASWELLTIGSETTFSFAGNLALKKAFSNVGRREGEYVNAYNEPSYIFLPISKLEAIFAK